jgi:hypothetical protein
MQSKQQERTKLMDQKLQSTVNNVHDYWNTHTLGFQYVTDKSIKPGTREFFAHIRPWMNPYVPVDHGSHQ